MVFAENFQPKGALNESLFYTPDLQCFSIFLLYSRQEFLLIRVVGKKISFCLTSCKIFVNLNSVLWLWFFFPMKNKSDKSVECMLKPIYGI